MINKRLAKRIFICIVGSFIYASGVCIMTRAALGISPISSFPYVLSLLSGFTLGTCTMGFNVLLIVLQKIALRKEYTLRIIALQMALSLIFSVFIDLSIFLFGWFSPQAYLGKLLYLLFGCAVLATGVSLVVIANFAVLPGEGAAQVIARFAKKEFGIAKIMFDCACVVMAIVISLIGFGRIEGIREGTVIAALLIGTCARFVMQRLRPLVGRFLTDGIAEEPLSEVTTEA